MAENVKTMEKILAALQSWYVAWEAEELTEVEVDFRDPELSSKLSRLRDPVKWAHALEETSEKARAAGKLEFELCQAMEAIFKKQPAPPDVIFYVLASLAYRYRKQAAGG